MRQKFFSTRKRRQSWRMHHWNVTMAMIMRRSWRMSNSRKRRMMLIILGTVRVSVKVGRSEERSRWERAVSCWLYMMAVKDGEMQTAWWMLETVIDSESAAHCHLRVCYASLFYRR